MPKRFKSPLKCPLGQTLAATTSWWETTLSFLGEGVGKDLAKDWFGKSTTPTANQPMKDQVMHLLYSNMVNKAMLKPCLSSNPSPGQRGVTMHISSSQYRTSQSGHLMLGLSNHSAQVDATVENHSSKKNKNSPS